MRIPENKIEEIRSAANIVDVVSEFVQIRKRGKNFIGLCPFHNEKTPSFTVNEEKQIFHCFGCHAGGNVYKFLMDYEKISFMESVQELANRVGISIEYDQESSSEKQTEQEILYDINTLTAKYFSDNLLNKKEGEVAQNYFHNRKIKLPIMRAFGLGYAFPGRDLLVDFLKEQKVDLNKAMALGLIGSSSDGRLYDKFSGRIIFPIFSPNGRVVAFAGRVFNEKEGTAKYLNSPESLIYTKGRILYGLSHAKDEIRKLDRVILVEGYMDLISLYQGGIKNVVAVSGTALTEEQSILLSRYTKNVALLFDADTAGIKASMRSIEILLKRDMEIKIASLPKGEDPDSFIHNFGKEKFDEIIKRALNFIEYQSAYYESQGMFEDANKTAEAIRELVKPIALIKDELKRNLLIKSIAKKFNLREKLIETELEKAINQTGKQLTAEERTKIRERIKAEPDASEQSSKKTSPAIYKLEREIIKLLFEGNKEVIEFISAHIPPEEFLIEAHSKIAGIVYEACVSDEEIIVSSLIEKINDENLQSFILELTFDKYQTSKKWEYLYPGIPREKILNKIARDTIRKFKALMIENQIALNHQKILLSENENEKIDFMRRNLELERSKQQLKDELKNEEEYLSPL
ncbi:MAG: DNA primase [Ignavibacteriaceae bacterium]